MDRFAVFLGQVLHETLRDQSFDHRLVPREELPALRVGKVGFGIGFEHLGRVMFGINRHRDKFHPGCFDQRFLHFKHARGHERTRARTPGENEVGNPDFTAQIGRGDLVAVLVGQGKFRDGTDDRQLFDIAPHRSLPHRIAHGHGEDETKKSPGPAQLVHPAADDVFLVVVVHGVRRWTRRQLKSNTTPSRETAKPRRQSANTYRQGSDRYGFARCKRRRAGESGPRQS